MTGAPLLAKHRGNMAAISWAAGVSRQSEAEFLSDNPDLKADRLDQAEGKLDDAEGALYRVVLAGEE